MLSNAVFDRTNCGRQKKSTERRTKRARERGQGKYTETAHKKSKGADYMINKNKRIGNIHFIEIWPNI